MSKGTWGAGDTRQPTYKVQRWLRIAGTASGGTNIKKQSGIVVFFSPPLHSEHECTQAGRNGAQVASGVSNPTCQTAHGAQVASVVSFPTYPSRSCRMPLRLEAMARWSGRGIEGGRGQEWLEWIEFIFDDPKLPEASQPLEAMRRWSGRGIEGGGGRSSWSGLGAARPGAGGAPSSPAVPYPPPPFSP